MSSQQTAFLFDLDGMLVDSVYEHVLAWHEALETEGIELSIWRIIDRICAIEEGRAATPHR
jgi:beta-phosphoglucomutase-like phosphatase (HAD superfamily)